MSKPHSPEWYRAIDRLALKDEVEERIQSMSDTGDVPPDERERTALEDIIALSADDHGCYLATEKNDWNGIRRAARERLRALKKETS